MNLKLIVTLICLSSCLIIPLSAKDDTPRGFDPLSDLQEEQAKAKGKKLIVLVVKGMDDNCPKCSAALENGDKALRSGVVKIFARAETIKKADSSSFTPALKKRINEGFVTGASITFVVFNPDMTSILAEATRDDLYMNKKTIAAFKKEVQQAKKALK